MKKLFLLIFKICVSFGLVGWLIAHVDWLTIRQELASASVPLLFLALGFYLGSIILSIVRWRATAHFKSFTLSFKDAWTYNLAGLFLNNFLPSFIGGDAYRSYLLGKHEGRYAAAASTVLFVRFTGLWATIFLFLFFGFLSFDQTLGRPIFGWLALGLTFVLVTDVLLTLFSDHVLIQKFFAIFPLRLKNFFTELSGYTDRRFAFRSFVVSLSFTFLGVGLFNATLFWALGEKLPFLEFFSIIFLISVISSIPVSISNIGIKEWAYFTFFPAIGMNPEAALAVALLGRFLQIIVSLGGAFFVLRKKQEIKMVQSSAATDTI